MRIGLIGPTASLGPLRKRERERSARVRPLHACYDKFTRPYGSMIMEDVTYTKGIYTATAGVQQLDDGRFQGVVHLSRDDATEPETTVYEVKGVSATVSEALEEAKALAHQILGELEL